MSPTEFKPVEEQLAYLKKGTAEIIREEELKEKIAKPREEIERLNALNARLMASEDKQISLGFDSRNSPRRSAKSSPVSPHT